MRSLIGTAEDLGVIHICERLFEVVPIYLVLRDVMSKASVVRLVVFLGRNIDLRTARCSGEVRSNKTKKRYITLRKVY